MLALTDTQENLWWGALALGLVVILVVGSFAKQDD